jgi:cell division protein FtsB
MQQINLYPLLPKKDKFQLNSIIILASYGSFLFLLLVITFALWMHKRPLEAQYSQLNEQVSKLQRELNVIQQKYPESDIVHLKNNIQALQQQIESKSKVINSLQSNTHFSFYLTGLASVAVPNLWLTEISFDNTKQEIGLNGLAQQSELVEILLAQLEKQSAFAALKFYIQNVSELGSPISFNILSKRIGLI